MTNFNKTAYNCWGSVLNASQQIDVTIGEKGAIMSDEDDIIWPSWMMMNLSSKCTMIFMTACRMKSSKVSRSCWIVADSHDVLTKALVDGMTVVGNDFRDGILLFRKY